MATSRTALSPTAAQSPLSARTRNEIYSSLLSGNGVRNIEQTLTHELQRSGWLSDLKAYITQLLRTGECTTLDEVMARVLDKVETADKSNGVNGNGVHGVNGVNGHDKEAEDVDLRIPDKVIREGTKTIRRELENVCEITDD